MDEHDIDFRSCRYKYLIVYPNHIYTLHKQLEMGQHFGSEQITLCGVKFTLYHDFIKSGEEYDNSLKKTNGNAIGTNLYPFASIEGVPIIYGPVAFEIKEDCIQQHHVLEILKYKSMISLKINNFITKGVLYGSFVFLPLTAATIFILAGFFIGRNK